LNATIARSLPAIGTTDGTGNIYETKAQVKFFAKGGLWEHFYATEFDGQDELFGCFVTNDGGCEWSYASFRELERTTVPVRVAMAGGPAREVGRVPVVERDCYWSPMSVREAIVRDGHPLPAGAVGDDGEPTAPFDDPDPGQVTGDAIDALEAQMRAEDDGLR
jgi:hypothetical protein